MIYNKFIICSTTKAFEDSFAAGDIVDQHIVFIEETGKIWTNGRMYGVADVTDLPPAGDAGSGEPGLVIVGNNISITDGVISITEQNIENALGYIPVSAEKSDGTVNPVGELVQLTQAGLPIYPIVKTSSIVDDSGSGETIDDKLTNITESVNNKVDDAPKNGKAYVRKDGAWDALDLGDLGDVTLGDTNVQSDWAETDTTSDAYIKNKPTTLAELGISEVYETRGRGSNSVTTLANLPIDKALVIASLSSATSISLSSAMNVGESITIVATPSADFTQPLPTTGSFISMDGDSLSVNSGVEFEINILCIASGKYSISCKVAV